MEMIEEHRCFEGWQQRWRHHSAVLNCTMTVSVFLPPPVSSNPPPILYWLSGLTCNDENFTTKANAQRVAAELRIVLFMPDTSPRGDDVADDDGYDLGKGAGFYLNASQQPWAAHYRMYDYLRDELPALIQQHFNVSDRCAISGHSMGGHGALIMALKNPGRFTSVSAFAPIVNPVRVPWGQKAFSAYLGDDQAQWVEWWIRGITINSWRTNYSRRNWRKWRARPAGRSPCASSRATITAISLLPRLLKITCVFTRSISLPNRHKQKGYPARDTLFRLTDLSEAVIHRHKVAPPVFVVAVIFAAEIFIAQVQDTGTQLNVFRGLPGRARIPDNVAAVCR